MAGNAAGIKAGKAYVSVGTDNSPLSAGLKQASAKLKSWGASIASIGAAVGGAGTAFTGSFLGAAKAFADVGSELNDMSTRTGLSVEALSQLGHAANQTGADLATVEIASKKLSKNLAEAAQGSAEARVMFAELGLDFRKLLQLSPDKQFEAVAKALGRIQNPALKAGMALAIFGKSGTSLLPLIAEFDALTGEARKLGLVMSAEDAAAADALGDAWDNILAMFKRGTVLIGAALAPALTELAVNMTGVIKGTLDWINNNRPLVATLFKAAAATVVVGAAIVAVGAIFGGLGAILAGISAGMVVLGAVFSAIISPIGLTIIALSGLGVAFVKYTDMGTSALKWLGARFWEFAGRAEMAMFGVQGALNAGDIPLAAKVLWLALKVEFIRGQNFIAAVWAQIKSTAKGVWAEIGFTIQGALVNSWAAIKIGAIGAFGAIQDAAGAAMAFISGTFTTLVGTLQKLWNLFAGDFTKTWLKIQAVFSGDFSTKTRKAIDKKVDAEVEKQNQGVDQQTADALAAIKKQRDDAAKAREKGRGKQGDEINADKDKELGDIEAARRQAEKDREAEKNAGGKEGLDHFEAAQKELEDALEEARQKARNVEPPGMPKKGKGGPEFDEAGLEAGLEGAARSVDVKGTFSGSAVGGLGTGDTLTDYAKNQLSEAKKTNEKLTAINRSLSFSGGLI
jgi:hypothetical protein